MSKQYIGIVRDHSASMANYRVTEAARKDYNQQINAIREAAIREGIDTVLSVVECGVDWAEGGVNKALINSSIAAVHVLNEYIATGGSTPLYDSIGTLIEIFENLPDANQPEVSFLIVAITDGGENSSRRWRHNLSSKIRQLQSTDRWSFVARVPVNHGNSLRRNLGIPEGNIIEWAQTSRDLERVSTETQTGYTNYFQAKAAAGNSRMSTRSFYTANLNQVDKAAVKKALVDVTSQVKFFDVAAQDNGKQIRPFIEEKNGSAPLGSGFYQLSKKEEVQDHKLFAVRDKRTKKVYSGVEARTLLGIPDTGTIKLEPGNHGDFDIFVQSKSVNRKLVGGTQLMFWNNVGSPR